MLKLYIVVGNDGFLGQSYNTWKSIDIEQLKEYFLIAEIDIEIVYFSAISNFQVEIENSYIFYTSSEKEMYRKYIEDNLLYLTTQKNVLIPSFYHFKCHENKGFQEFFKKSHGISSSLSTLYYGTLKDINNKKIIYPKVFKTIDGAGSSGVSIVNSLKELQRTLKQNVSYTSKIKKPILYLRNKLLRSKQDQLEYSNYHSVDLNFVLQEFVPNLSNDYKILVFSSKIFILKRYIRNNDFRASGSGKFEFVTQVNTPLLDYVENIFAKMKAPFVSLDICEKNNKFYLIEFQFNHFGPYTIQQSKGYFSKNDTTWKYVQAKSILELEIVNSISKFIKSKNNA